MFINYKLAAGVVYSERLLNQAVKKSRKAYIKSLRR